MAELPAGWGLKTKANDKGTLDIIGKDDSGKEYKVRTTDKPYVSDTDVAELHDADRETYKDTSSGARAFVSQLTESAKKREQDREDAFYDDLTEAALPVVRAGFEREQSTVSLSGSYERGERYFRWKQQFFGES